MTKDFEIIDGKYIVRDVVPCYDVDSSLRIKPVAFMNIAQEMATRAADHLGFGYADLMSKNMAWVVSRMHFKVVDAPHWKDELVLATWHKGVQGPFFVRDFSVCGSDGSPKVLATSSWVVLDTEKRSMVRISDIENMIPENSACYENAIERLAPKIMMPRGSEPQLVQSVKLGYSDIDMNAHTNNARYIQYAMNCFDYESLHDKNVSEVFITFNHETYAGETLDLYMLDKKPEDLTNTESEIPIVRNTIIEGKVGNTSVFCTKIVF